MEPGSISYFDVSLRYAEFLMQASEYEKARVSILLILYIPIRKVESRIIKISFRSHLRLNLLEFVR